MGDDAGPRVLRHVAPRGFEVRDAVVELAARHDGIDSEERLDLGFRRRALHGLVRVRDPFADLYRRFRDQLEMQHRLIRPPQAVCSRTRAFERCLPVLRVPIPACDAQDVAQYVRGHVGPERVAAALPS